MDKCYHLVNEKRDKTNTVVNTFGIGDCNKHFVQRIADDGDGVCVTLGTEEVSKLRSKVIEILSQSLKPCLKDFTTKFAFTHNDLTLHPVIHSQAIRDAN